MIHPKKRSERMMQGTDSGAIPHGMGRQALKKMSEFLRKRNLSVGSHAWNTNGGSRRPPKP